MSPCGTSITSAPDPHASSTSRAVPPIRPGNHGDGTVIRPSDPTIRTALSRFAVMEHARRPSSASSSNETVTADVRSTPVEPKIAVPATSTDSTTVPDVVPTRGVDDLFGIGMIHREGLLAEDVLPGVGRIGGPLAMQGVIRGHVHDIDLAVLDHAVVPVVMPRYAEPRGERGGPGAVAAPDGHELPAAGRRDGARHDPGDLAGPPDAPADGAGHPQSRGIIGTSGFTSGPKNLIASRSVDPVLRTSTPATARSCVTSSSSRSGSPPWTPMPPYVPEPDQMSTLCTPRSLVTYDAPGRTTSLVPLNFVVP